MFSLEVHIRNLTPTDTLPNRSHQSLEQTPITIRFGPLQSDIIVSSGQNPNADVGCAYSGGKRLLLEMQMPEIQSLLTTYAFGLFMQNGVGRFWCVLSLEKVAVGDNYFCDGLVFYNDDRQSCYKFQLGVKLMYHNPRVPKNAHAQQNQPIVIAPPNNKDKKIKSFLYGKKNSQVIQTLQPPSYSHNHNLNQTQNQNQNRNRNNRNQQIDQPPLKKNSMSKKTKVTYTYAVAQYLPVTNNFVGPQSDDETGIYIPPIMQFVNNQHQSQQPYQSPYQQPPQQNIQHHSPQKQLSRTLPKFQTFEDYSQFRQYNQKSKNIKNVPSLQKQSSQQKPLTRQQLRQLARKQAQAHYTQKQKQIMIPVPNTKTGTYQLVPLSSLTEAQILEYAHKQKLAQQYKKNQEQQKRKQKLKQQKKKKRQMHIGKVDKQTLRDIKKQNIGVVDKNYKQRISQKNKQSSGSQNSQSYQQEQQDKPIRQSNKNQPKQKNQNQNINQKQTQNTQAQQQPQSNNKKAQNLKSKSNSNQQNSNQSQNSEERDQFHNLSNNNQGQEQQNYQDDYQSDFQSISNAGSLIKSRKSLQSSISMSQSHQKQKQKRKQKEYNPPHDPQREAKYNEINDKYLYYLNKNKNTSRKSSQLEMSQSMDDYGYSQEFDSFSQSVLSKNKRGSSISEISGDYGYIPSINYGSSGNSGNIRRV